MDSAAGMPSGVALSASTAVAGTDGGSEGADGGGVGGTGGAGVDPVDAKRRWTVIGGRPRKADGRLAIDGVCDPVLSWGVQGVAGGGNPREVSGVAGTG